MRDIKFRQYHKDTDNFYYWGIGIKGAIFTSPTISQGYVIEPPHEQFIGLTDKNGTEIFEGDILEIKIHDWSRKDIVFVSGKSVVEFRDCKFGVYWGFNQYFTSLNGFSNNTTFEVIGNIHRNPKLLVTNHDK